MKNLTCICCGAPINRFNRKCEYCGTEYEIEDEIPKIRFETFQNPVREYKACILVNREEIAFGGEDYMRHAIRSLAESMLPAVMEGMSVRIDDEPLWDRKQITGRIKMVIPEDKR